MLNDRAQVGFQTVDQKPDPVSLQREGTCCTSQIGRGGIASRREFLKTSVLTGIAASTGWGAIPQRAMAEEGKEKKGGEIRYGLVTYQWGKDWDLPTLLKNCERAKVLGVELRTTHKHGVEPSLSERQREEVRRQFEKSPVQMVGIGSNERFDSPDPKVLQAAIDATKAFIQLSHDVGGSGVKVKPDSFHKDVPREQTIAQIGRALNEVAEYATGFGQQIRLEVHGQCAQLPTIRAILDVADHPNVATCWNSNPQDLEAPGLEHNFNLVKDRLGQTTHIHRFDVSNYPWAELMDLFVKVNYSGWMMLEEGVVPADPAEELIKQRELFEQALSEARQRVG
ncbi:sugar phosphate isomerase/epimerase family protein [Schlesneria sp. T3-172]|uniref:sugar phosphate isomerase/epimerase family protein n=1 Tax=Schlesneria sphaerica TaxID=3373610 RepID=UPI0037C68D9A